MDDHFDCVVVGTGLRRLGDRAAARRGRPPRARARARQGRIRRARSRAAPSASATTSGIPSEGLQGLFDVWSFSGLDAVISSGLGGGSLIYANVLLRKDERWFVSPERPGPGGESWPITRADLEPHYDRVGADARRRSATRSSTRPTTRTPKTLAFKAAAEERGHGLVPAAARRHVRQRGRGPGARRADPRRSGPTSTGARARPAGWSASATSAATTAPRTRSTTPT